MKHTTVMAGRPSQNASLFRRIGLPLGDPAAWIDHGGRTTAIVRDLEMDRVRQIARTDSVVCPADHAPPTGLSADRETATAQSLVQWLRQHRIERVTVDRTLPKIYDWHLDQAEIATVYDDQFGVTDRRQKTAAEIDSLRAAQQITEAVIRRVCERIATASVDDDGHLIVDNEVLTSENVRQFAAIEFLRRDCTMSHGGIVAGPPHSGDCHHAGTGPLRSGVPIIIDLFPHHDANRFWGDCTRTVVHGRPTDAVVAMHAAVIAAKSAATEQLRPGRTAESVHNAATDVLLSANYPLHRGTITDAPSIQHGTGHGVGLDLHEPILLDEGGGEILDGEVFTVEPGLYGRRDGGVRVEDMIVATEEGPLNLNNLPQGLNWRP